VRKAPVTTDPASAPQPPQQRQDERQDPRQEQQRHEQQRQEQQRQEQHHDARHEQQTQRHAHQSPAHESGRESTAREAVREDTPQRPAGRLEDEWQAVQYEFVDDPKSAVRKADDLVQRAIQELTSRHRTLSQQWQGEGKHETEDLRLALHRYRELFKSLVAVK
jgi:hypothetical protein